MTKRLVDIDDDLLEAARRAAGEPTIKATVATALERLVSSNRRDEEDLRRRWESVADALVDLHDEEVMKGAWS